MWEASIHLSSSSCKAFTTPALRSSGDSIPLIRVPDNRRKYPSRFTKPILIDDTRNDQVNETEKNLKPQKNRKLAFFI